MLKRGFGFRDGVVILGLETPPFRNIPLTTGENMRVKSLVQRTGIPFNWVAVACLLNDSTLDAAVWLALELESDSAAKVAEQHLHWQNVKAKDRIL